MLRLGLDHEASGHTPIPKQCCPAAGQGAIGVEIRKDDRIMAGLLDAIHCKITGMRIVAERAALQILNGSCHTPIGAFATIDERRDG